MAMYGTMLRAGLEGYTRGNDLRYQEEQRGLKRETQELQLDNAKWKSNRARELAGREDKQYNRQQEGMDAVRTFVTTGDTQGLTNFLNDYTPDNMQHDLKKSEQGGYDIEVTVDGTTKSKHFESEDEFMPYMMMFVKQNPYEEIDRQRDTKAATAADERDHQQAIELQDREYEHKKGIEWLKNMFKEGKKGRGGWKHLRDISNDMENRANRRRGEETLSGKFVFSGFNRDLANYDAMLGTKYYDTGMDTNAAYTKAHNIVNQIYKSAQDAAIAATDDKEQQEQIVRATMDQAVASHVNAMNRGSQNQGLVRPGQQGGAQGKAGTQGKGGAGGQQSGAGLDKTSTGAPSGTKDTGKKPSKKAINALLKNPEKAAEFDEYYYPGAAMEYAKDADPQVRSKIKAALGETKGGGRGDDLLGGKGLTGNQVGYTSEGRPMIENEDGSRSSERTVTINDPRINNGRATNIPTMFNGKQVSVKRAIDIIAENNSVDPETGRKLPGYSSITEAEKAAQERSKGIGKGLKKGSGKQTNPANNQVKKGDLERHKAKAEVDVGSNPEAKHAMQTAIRGARKKVDQAKDINSLSTGVLQRALHSTNLPKNVQNNIVSILNRRETKAKKGGNKVAESYGFRGKIQ